MSIELLQCPFCGAQPSTTPIFCMGYAGDGISCRCGAETPKHLVGIKATQWWNRRPQNNRTHDKCTMHDDTQHSALIL